MPRLERRLMVAGAAALVLFAAPAFATKVDISKNPPVDVGPPTTYGETPAEAANKRVMFEFVHMVMVERKPAEAFEEYVSPDYCNHGHLSTFGWRDCAGYTETARRWIREYSSPVYPGETIEMPTIATVDGEMVTMYGDGVDIFRVHDGKITDHWDASPPAEVQLGAHSPAFSAWAMSTHRVGPPPHWQFDPKPHLVVTQDMLDHVEVGPPTPYGETKAEAAAKRLVFEAVHMQYFEGKPRQAVEEFYSQDLCDHSHMSTAGQKDCTGFAARLARAVAVSGKIPKVGGVIEVPTMASVDGEMVTMYGAGVDIFQVHDGKIVAHWDGSPPVPLVIKAHDPAMAANMQKVVDHDPTARLPGTMRPPMPPAKPSS